MTSLEGINGRSIQTLLRGENDSKQSDEFQARPVTIVDEKQLIRIAEETFKNSTASRHLFPVSQNFFFFYFVLFLPYISFEFLAAILPSKPARAPSRCPEFQAMHQNVEPKRLDSKKIRVNLERTPH